MNIDLAKHKEEHGYAQHYIDHSKIQNSGTNTHIDIDTHIADDDANPHSTNFMDVFSPAHVANTCFHYFDFPGSGVPNNNGVRVANGATFAQLSTNLWGIARITTSTTNNSQGGFFVGQDTLPTLKPFQSNRDCKLLWRVGGRTVPRADNTMFFGFSATNGDFNASTEGAFFKADAGDIGSWQCITMFAGGSEVTDTAIATSSKYLGVECNSGSVVFTFNKSAIAVHSSVVPINAMWAGAYIVHNAAGGLNEIIQVDAMKTWQDRVA